MTTILSKPPNEIDWEDIQILTDQHIPEDQHIEYKNLFDKSEQTNSENSPNINDSMKDKICRTVVAFANSFGGALILGISESSDTEESHQKQGVAKNIVCFQNCRSIADGLVRTLNDRIEPRLPRLDIISVLHPNSESRGEGVIVIRTRRSFRAPHCVTFKQSKSKPFPTKSCATRRGNKTEELTMNEVQDLTLNLSRGTERIEKKLKNRSDEFHEKFNFLKEPKSAWGVRMTAIPIAEGVRFGSVYSNQNLLERYRPDTHDVSYKNNKICNPGYWKIGNNQHWYPKLRAAVRSNTTNIVNDQVSGQIYQEIHWDGLIENVLLIFRSQEYEVDSRIKHLPPIFCCCTWLIYCLANHLVWVNKAKRSANCLNSEYAVNIEIDIIGDDHLQVLKAKSDEPWPQTVKLPPERLEFPSYQFNSRNEIEDLIGSFVKDLINAAGSDIDISPSDIKISDSE